MENFHHGERFYPSCCDVEICPDCAVAGLDEERCCFGEKSDAEDGEEGVVDEEVSRRLLRFGCYRHFYLF